MDRRKAFALGQSCLAVLKVEAFFKPASVLVIGPLLNWIFTVWVLGDTPVFNEEMFLSVLSPVRLILTIVLFLAAALWCCYEISCLLHTLYWCRKGERPGLIDILRSSAETLKGLKHISILLAGVYFVLFLPLVHAGYLNSLVSRIDIPRFVVNELKKTTLGSMGILAGRAGYIILFLALALIPPAMFLKRTNFLKAVQQNFYWFRLMQWKDKMKLWGAFFLWIAVEGGIVYLLQGRLIQSQDFNISVLKYLVHSGSFRTGFLYWILLVLIQCVAMALIYQFMFDILDKYEELPELPGIKNTKALGRTVAAAAGGRRALIRTGKKFWNSRKHKKIWAGFAILLIAAVINGYFNEAPLVHKPLAIGHRGCIYEPENTIAAVEKAVSLGADYAEIDVKLSKDGVPVVVHDESLKRLAGISGKVESMTAAELKELTITSNGKQGKIPTFEEMIQAVQGMKNRAGLLVELKPTSDTKEELVRKVIEVVEKNSAQKQCIFMSIDYKSVSLLKEQRPDWWVGYCIFGSAGKIEDAVWDYNIDFLAVEEGVASNRFMERARNSLIPVYIWTSNNYDDMANYLQMGASGITTDMPDLARAEIDKYLEKGRKYYVYEGNPVR